MTDEVKSFLNALAFMYVSNERNKTYNSYDSCYERKYLLDEVSEHFYKLDDDAESYFKRRLERCRVEFKETFGY